MEVIILALHRKTLTKATRKVSLNLSCYISLSPKSLLKSFPIFHKLSYHPNPLTSWKSHKTGRKYEKQHNGCETLSRIEPSRCEPLLGCEPSRCETLSGYEPSRSEPSQDANPLAAKPSQDANPQAVKPSQDTNPLAANPLRMWTLSLRNPLRMRTLLLRKLSLLKSGFWPVSHFESVFDDFDVGFSPNSYFWHIRPPRLIFYSHIEDLLFINHIFCSR